MAYNVSFSLDNCKILSDIRRRMAMRYTIKQCKADMLLIWGFLRDNPQYTNKITAIDNMNITDAEKDRLRDLDSACPCCEYSVQIMKERGGKSGCSYCPIWTNHTEQDCIYHTLTDKRGEYEKWCRGKAACTRKRTAGVIYNLALQINDEVEDDNS
jgi:hypothetical protein